ncbi:helix-turn-helix transcriptional regulator [Candidatus Saccharibacteria bacterium]|jgi:DNA-binding PadR family transcriptional regulator|nr:helix-turn-helix transcriptional regulator [Candidatus Saccharibacteria bacterium]MBP7018348.1 helix-turn-helix transcriptional regulator [Candidatus Saccharibacteria bacterium]MBP9132194.1 helix-turn-helix transcriptional regulator [Candidatus Saccharibacteria bacterium]
MLSEQEELAVEIVDRWTANHKKSMATFVILVALSNRPMWSKQLEKWLREVIGWELTERGLHRILHKMNSSGLVEFQKTSSPKSGAGRKIYKITSFGSTVANSFKESGLSYLQNDEFSKLLRKL